MKMRHEFVNHVPDQLDDGVLYVSLRFGTIVHRCACGCGEEVVTPLGPAEWKLTYDGKTISLAPSIGNWSFPCESHYWVEEGNVRWARDFSGAEVVRVRQKARMRRDGHYRPGRRLAVATEAQKYENRDPVDEEERGSTRTIWERIQALGRRWRRSGR